MGIRRVNLCTTWTPIVFTIMTARNRASPHSRGIHPPSAARVAAPVVSRELAAEVRVVELLRTLCGGCRAALPTLQSPPLGRFLPHAGRQIRTRTPPKSLAEHDRISFQHPWGRGVTTPYAAERLDADWTPQLQELVYLGPARIASLAFPRGPAPGYTIDQSRRPPWTRAPG